MTRRLSVPLVLTLGFLALLVALLIAGGVLVRSILTSSYADAEYVRAARIAAGDAVRAQLDEETGVRGFSAVRDPLLLQPYFRGRAVLPSLLRRLRSAGETLGLHDARRLVADADATNRRWLRQVARPLLLVKGRNGHVLELHGKILVDRFRDDLAAIDAALLRRERQGDARAQRAIGLANVFAIGAVVAVIVAAALFTIQQYRLAVRLEQERATSEEQRRRAAESRAAYEAEKRIADTLQDAFAQRVLPELPGVRLSATYEPATEEAKIGGDWYDAVQLPHDRVLLAIGDVAGHGIEAAVAMNKTRQMLISSALVDPTPGSMLERVNAELIAANFPMITALAGLVDARAFEFSYAAAGHPAPVLFEPGRRARFLEVGELPLGISPDAAYATHRVKSVPGAMLVLYTDGVIEHSHDVLSGESLLLEAVEAAARRAGEDPARDIRDVIFDRHRVSDDIAILTIHFMSPAAAAAVPDAAVLQRTA
ncbi:MAG: SpoIIE family protein phosphatase [Candidatus Eremiobacteraeota bacterium]|nr:SpoIIE family protein phosphatase [Candidatus Eremiobacteraeota bacterium]